MSKLSHSHPDHEPIETCAHCGEATYPEDLNVEAFELCGEVVCGECAEAVFEDNSQLGVGA